MTFPTLASMGGLHFTTAEVILILAIVGTLIGMPGFFCGVLLVKILKHVNCRKWGCPRVWQISGAPFVGGIAGAILTWMGAYVVLNIEPFRSTFWNPWYWYTVPWAIVPMLLATYVLQRGSARGDRRCLEEASHSRDMSG